MWIEKLVMLVGDKEKGKTKILIKTFEKEKIIASNELEVQDVCAIAIDKKG